jgi:hypothetical protein
VDIDELDEIGHDGILVFVRGVELGEFSCVWESLRGTTQSRIAPPGQEGCPRR